MAENIKNIKAQVRSLEEELKVLKTSVEHAPKSKKKHIYFFAGNLEGENPLYNERN